MIDPAQMIFICGFTRGGTTWLRNCVGTHPDICEIKKELALFRNTNTRKEVIRKMTRHECASCKYYIEKSPSNARHLPKALTLLSEAKYLFIVRDPRDAFISHKRSTEPWTNGSNSTVQGCLGKLEAYYRGYAAVQDYRQVFLVRYEDLQMRFSATLAEVFGFLEVPSNAGMIADSYRENSFLARTGRMPGDEVRSAHRRKGIMGDWRNHLDDAEATWIRQNEFWQKFMDDYSYVWDGAP